MTKPMEKQEGERAQNCQFPVREHQSGAERVRERQSGADRVSEGVTVAPAPSERASDVPESAVEVQPVPVPSTVEGPTASIRLNPRQGRGQRNILNVKSTSVKSYLATLERVRELRAECKWTQRQALAAWMAEVTDPEEGFIDTSIPDVTLRAMKASKKGKNPDLPNCCEAMEGPHREQFKEAMQKEVDALEKHGTWQGTLRSSIPEGAEVVPLTWAFRIKRLPNGDFDKFKAGLVVRGDLQSDERETFAPCSKNRIACCLH